MKNWTDKYNIPTAQEGAQIPFQQSVEEALKFQQDWQNSPKYKQMLEKSAPEDFEKIATGRQNNLEDLAKNRNTKIVRSENEYGPEGETGGTNSRTGNITMYTTAPEYAVNHEISHNTDTPPNIFSKRLIPYSDIAMMKSYTPFSYEETPDYLQSTGSDRNFLDQNKEMYKGALKYYSVPTEVRARLLNMRKFSKDNNIFDPYTQEMTPENYDTIFNKDEKHDYDDLRKIYTKEQVINLMNTVSDNSEYKQPLTIAQAGTTKPKPRLNLNPNPATRQDSLNVYNNSRKVEAWYKANDYNKYLDDSEPYKPLEYNEAAYKAYKGTGTRTDKGFFESNTVPKSEYRKPVDLNRYYQRENADSDINTNAPMMLYDKRIIPKSSKTYLKNTDAVGIPTYNSIATKPFDLLTDKEKAQRVKQYGREGVPTSYKVPGASPVITASAKPITRTTATPIPSVRRTVIPASTAAKRSAVSPAKLIVSKPIERPKLEALKSMDPIDVNQMELQANLPTVEQLTRVPQRIPKSYKIEEYTQGSAPYINQQSNYQVTDLSELTAQSPNNKRKITPQYQQGGTAYPKINPATWQEFLANKEVRRLADAKVKKKVSQIKIKSERQETIKDNTPNFKPKEIKTFTAESDKVRDDRIAAEREAKIQASVDAQNTPYTTENWRKQLAAETNATGDKFRISNKPNIFDDYLNPAVMIGDMASGLGQAPLRAEQSDSYMPYVTSIGTPLAVGALAGMGAQNTGQFVNNLANPLAGTEGLLNRGVTYLENKGIRTAIAPELREGLKTNGLTFKTSNLPEGYGFKKDGDRLFLKNRNREVGQIELMTPTKDVEGNSWAPINIEIDPDYRGKKLSRPMYDAILDLANDKGMKGIYSIDGSLQSPAQSKGIRKYFKGAYSNDENLLKNTNEGIEETNKYTLEDNVNYGENEPLTPLQERVFLMQKYQTGGTVDMYGSPITANLQNSNIPRSFYDPRTNVANLGNDYANMTQEQKDKLIAHENRHAWQYDNNRSNFNITHRPQEAFNEMLQKKPNMVNTDDIWNDYHNRQQTETDMELGALKENNPQFTFVPNKLLYDKGFADNLYDNPSSLEGEAQYYQNTGQQSFQRGGTITPWYNKYQ